MKNTNDITELLYYMGKFPSADYPELWEAVRKILEGDGEN